MAEIFLAEIAGAEGFQRTVVIKRLLPHMADDANFNAMFIDEAKLTARLVHPKIAQTYELGKVDGQLFIAMEFVDGIDVLAVLRECAHRRSRVPAEIAAHIIKEVLDALDFAHSQVDGAGNSLGIVHRDVSPSNVLLSRRGNVKLVDFGIARAAGSEHKTQAGTLKGKYGYMSPEQVLGNPIDARSDIFSTGIVLAEMLTGRRLFAAPNELDVLLMVRDAKLGRLDKFGGHISADLNALLRRALQKSPEQRYQSAAEFRDALDEWMFETRARVRADDVASLVDNLYADAWERKRQAMDAQAVAVPPEPNAAATPEVASAEALQAPRAVTASGSLDIATPSAPVSPVDAADRAAVAIDMEPLQLDEEVVGTKVRISSDASEASRLDPEAMRATEQQPAVAPEFLQFDVEEIEAIKVGAAEIEAADVTLDGSEQTSDIELERVFAAISLQDPDPSAIEFDDSDVEGESDIRQKRSAQIRLPTAQELATVTARVAPGPQLRTISGDAEDAGEFAETSAIRVFFQLCTKKATGLLVVSCGGIRKDIYICAGSPEFVSSNVATELFGEYLVHQSILSEGELAMALAMMPHYGGKLGDTLVGLGLMKPLEVFRMLTRQVRDKLVDVCSWSKGSYAWYPDRKNDHDSFPLDLDCLEVLGAGAMQLPSGFLHDWLGARADHKPRSEKNRALSPESFQLGGFLRGIYDSLDGRKTLNTLWKRYTDSEEGDRFLRAIYLMHETELIRFSG